MQILYKLVKPDRLFKLTSRLIPLSLALFIPLLTAGLYTALISSPADYQQGETVRIMYIHVPSAWLSMLLYGSVAMLSLGFLVWRHPMSFILANQAALIGLVFTSITLITGSIWGYPTWGTWWVWDARLTSYLILWFLYFGYLALSRGFDDEELAAKRASILALIGIINLPIIKWSVNWWNTLHQPASVLKASGPSIHPSMLTPLFLMFGALIILTILLLSLRLRTAILLRKRPAMMEPTHA